MPLTTTIEFYYFNALRDLVSGVWVRRTLSFEDASNQMQSFHSGHTTAGTPRKDERSESLLEQKFVMKASDKVVSP